MAKRLMALALVLLMACNAGAALGEQRYSEAYLDLFDTVTTVSGYAQSAEEFEKTAGEIYAGLKHLHQLFDIYEGYEGINNLYTINSTPGEKIPVEEDLLGLLLLQKDACEFSGGLMDATMGAVLQIWSGARTAAMMNPEEAKLPDPAELSEAAKHRGFDKVEIDAVNGTVCLLDPETQLDVGSAGKGYALQKVTAGLEGNYLITVGGSVCATGPKADGSPWIVGVDNPDGDGFLHKLKLMKGSIVTSGDYQRYFMLGDRRYHHIIDPGTLYPADKWRAVTVICGDSGLGDALSTTLFLLDLEEGKKVAEMFGAEAFWMDQEGNQYFTDGYKEYIK